MERLDRSVVIVIAVALAIGFALWALASSVAYVATELLVDWWEDETALGSYGAAFSIGGVKVEYGQLLGSLLAMLVVLSVAVPLLRYAARRRAAVPRL